MNKSLKMFFMGVFIGIIIGVYEMPLLKKLGHLVENVAKAIVKNNESGRECSASAGSGQVPLVYSNAPPLQPITTPGVYAPTAAQSSLSPEVERQFQQAEAERKRQERCRDGGGR